MKKPETIEEQVEQLHKAWRNLGREIVRTGVLRDMFFIWLGMVSFVVAAYLTGNLTF